MITASMPSPSQGVWQLGPIPVRAYALCLLAGILLAVWLGNRRWVARGGRPGDVVDIAVWAVPFGIVGARLYHVATDWQRYFGPGRDPLDAVRIWDGGIGIWGAIAAGALGAWIACRRKGISLPAMADALAPGIALGQAVGRWGNWFNQELYGRPPVCRGRWRSTRSTGRTGWPRSPPTIRLSSTSRSGTLRWRWF